MAIKNTTVEQEAIEAANVVCLTGPIRVEPIIRSGPEETILVTFDVVTNRGGTHKTVRVSWEGVAQAQPKVSAGQTVTVLGTVQRRCFRVGGTTAHTVDVRAARVARTPAARRRIIETARAQLDLAD